MELTNRISIVRRRVAGFDSKSSLTGSDVMHSESSTLNCVAFHFYTPSTSPHPLAITIPQLRVRPKHSITSDSYSRFPDDV